MKQMLVKISTFTCITLLLAGCSRNYSEGERMGIITKFSHKGLIWKSWEGDLKVAPNIGNGGMVGQYEDFYFSVDNEKSINCITSTDSITEFMKEGVPVLLIYQETRGYNYFQNRGETQYFIKEIKRAK